MSTNLATQVPLRVDVSKVDWKVPKASGPSPVSLHIVNDGFLIYFVNWLDPTSLFSINTYSGELKSLMIDNVPAFSGSNPNRMMTTLPTTLPLWESILITVGALLFGLVLVWGQDARERWRKRHWVDSRDIPGSKLAADMNDGDFEAYQSAHQEETGRRLQAMAQRDTRQQQDELEHRSVESRSHSRLSPQSLPQMLTVGEHSGRGSSTSLLTTTVLGNDEAMNGFGRPSPLLSGQSLESLQFSSHPRPNVVTTIADISAE